MNEYTGYQRTVKANSDCLASQVVLLKRTICVAVYDSQTYYTSYNLCTPLVFLRSAFTPRAQHPDVMKSTRLGLRVFVRLLLTK